jgi:hypothetical protein
MLYTKESHEKEEIYNAHCSTSLAYFIAAVGRQWSLRHRTAREAGPAVFPPYQSQLTDRSATRERQTKPPPLVHAKCDEFRKHRRSTPQQSSRHNEGEYN